MPLASERYSAANEQRSLKAPPTARGLRAPSAERTHLALTVTSFTKQPGRFDLSSSPTFRRRISWGTRTTSCIFTARTIPERKRIGKATSVAHRLRVLREEVRALAEQYAAGEQKTSSTCSGRPQIRQNRSTTRSGRAGRRTSAGRKRRRRSASTAIRPAQRRRRTRPEPPLPPPRAGLRTLWCSRPQRHHGEDDPTLTPYRRSLLR